MAKAPLSIRKTGEAIVAIDTALYASLSPEDKEKLQTARNNLYDILKRNGYVFIEQNPTKLKKVEKKK